MDNTFFNQVKDFVHQKLMFKLPEIPDEYTDYGEEKDFIDSLKRVVLHLKRTHWHTSATHQGWSVTLFTKIKNFDNHPTIDQIVKFANDNGYYTTADDLYRVKNSEEYLRYTPQSLIVCKWQSHDTISELYCLVNINKNETLD